MKILLITDLYPVKDNEYSTPKTLYDFVQGWRSLGHEVRIIKPNFILNSYIRKKPFYKSGYYDDILNINYWLPFCGDVKKRLGKFWQKDFHPDIVIAHMPSGILFADKLGIPFVAGIHCSDIAVLTKPVYSVYFRKAMEKALKNAKLISCRSYVIKNKLLKLYPDYSNKIFVAPSGIDEKNIIGDSIREYNPDSLKIITCANYKKRKNIDKLVAAVKDLKGVELTVIGKGYKKYEKISNNVSILGRLDNAEVLKEMQKSDVFILPSISETFGKVYLEAMACGCLTVCSENDGIDGIIENETNGFTVKPDIESIKELIIKIKNMDNARLNDIRKKSLDTVRLYTQKICCEKYLKNIMREN